MTTTVNRSHAISTFAVAIGCLLLAAGSIAEKYIGNWKYTMDLIAIVLFLVVIGNSFTGMVKNDKR